jgi:hypothetical protein
MSLNSVTSFQKMAKRLHSSFSEYYCIRKKTSCDPSFLQILRARLFLNNRVKNLRDKKRETRLIQNGQDSTKGCSKLNTVLNYNCHREFRSQTYLFGFVLIEADR